LKLNLSVHYSNCNPIAYLYPSNNTIQKLYHLNYSSFNFNSNEITLIFYTLYKKFVNKLLMEEAM